MNPKLYGFVKNHKSGNLIRQDVSYISSSIQQLRITINLKFKNLLHLMKFLHSVKNSLELVDSFKNKKILNKHVGLII